MSGCAISFPVSPRHDSILHERVDRAKYAFGELELDVGVLVGVTDLMASTAAPRPDDIWRLHPHAADADQTKVREADRLRIVIAAGEPYLAVLASSELAEVGHTFPLL